MDTNEFQTTTATFTPNDAPAPAFEMAQQTELTQNAAQKKKPNKRVIIAIICLCVFLAGGFGFYYYKTNQLTWEEDYSLSMARKLKKSLKSPSSMVIIGNMVYVYGGNDEKYTDSPPHDIVYIKYSGSNSYGVQINGAALFIDGDYYNYDESEYEYDDYSTATQEERDTYMLVLLCQKSVLECIVSYEIMGYDVKAYNNESTDSKIISGEKIAKRLKVSYEDE